MAWIDVLRRSYLRFSFQPGITKIITSDRRVVSMQWRIEVRMSRITRWNLVMPRIRDCHTRLAVTIVSEATRCSKVSFHGPFHGNKQSIHFDVTNRGNTFCLFQWRWMWFRPKINFSVQPVVDQYEQLGFLSQQVGHNSVLRTDTCRFVVWTAVCEHTAMLVSPSRRYVILTNGWSQASLKRFNQDLRMPGERIR